MSDRYKMRPIEDLEPHYSRHLAAMTREKLHAKSDIAAELACRDWEIERLTTEGARKTDVIDHLDMELEKLTAEVQSAFFAGCDYGSKYAGDQYLGTPERQRGFDQWKRDSGSQGCDHDWQIDDVLIESSVLPDTEVWKCTKCPATKKIAANSSPECEHENWDFQDRQSKYCHDCKRWLPMDTAADSRHEFRESKYRSDRCIVCCRPPGHKNHTAAEKGQ